MASSHVPTRDDDETEAKVAEGVYRLLDLLTEEVSIVTRPANKRPWLIRKDKVDPMLGQEIIETPDGLGTTIGDHPQQNQGSAQDAAKQEPIPAPVKSAALAMLQGASDRLAGLIVALKSANEVPGVTGYPRSFADETLAIATTLRGVTAKYPSSNSAESGAEYKVDSADIAPEVKAKALLVLEEGSNRLASVVAAIMSAAETEDQSPAPIPAEIGAELESIAALLASLCEAYPSAVAAGSEPSEKSLVSAAHVVDQAHEILGGVLAKIQPGKALDEDSHQKLEKIRVLLGSATTKEKPPVESQEAEKQESAEERSATEKSGAKMSRDRRRKFEEAIKVLSDLFREVSPSEEPESAQADAARVGKNHQDLAELREELSKNKAELDAVRAEFAAWKAQPTQSNVQAVESGAPQKTEKFRWPRDYNAKP